VYGDAFDRLFDRGRDAVLSGTHYRDSPPVEGGRWGISVILLPDAECTQRLDAITAEARRVAGGGHWPTGSRPAVHVTVRALEPHRSAVADDASRLSPGRLDHLPHVGVVMLERACRA
jgi:hypothetical protein